MRRVMIHSPSKSMRCILSLSERLYVNVAKSGEAPEEETCPARGWSVS